MTAQPWVVPQQGAPVAAPKPRRWVFRLGLVLLGLGVLLGGAGGALTAAQLHDYVVSSASMAPTLQPGAHVMTVPLNGAVPKRGDLVLVDAAGWNIPVLSFRRVIGVGGDRVACCTAGRVTVDGSALVEPYAASPGGGLPGYSVTVPAGRLFLLGDNRSDAIDSRMNLSEQQGTLPLSAVRGRVFWTSSGGWASGVGDTEAGTYLFALGAGLLLFALGLVALLVSGVLALVRRSRVRRTGLPARARIGS
jgi:signal peptidase I